MEQRNHLSGIAYILTAFFLFTTMTLLTRYASKMVPLSMILLFQNAMGLASVLPWLKKHGWDLLRTDRFGLILLRSLGSLSSIGLSFLAVQRISLVNTMLFANTAPLWIPFVIWIWLKKPIRHILWPGLIGGFLGVILILKPGASLIHQYGTLFAIGAGFFSGINMVLLRQLSYTERNHSVLFYYFLICSAICLPWGILEWTSPPPLAWAEIFAIAACLTLGQWAFVRAFHHAPASQLGPFCYSAVVYSILLDWALFGEIPDLWAWVGIGLVCAGGIWAIRMSKATS